MKKLLSLFMMCVLASTAWAFDVVFDATVDFGTGSTTAGEFSIEKDCVTIHVAQGLANGVHYRFYKNQPVTISSNCGPITRVVFECVAEGTDQYGPGCFTVNVGDYGYAGKIGIWTGQSDVIVFTPSLIQVGATKIIVSVGECGLVAPTIKPASGTYYAPFEVSITCLTSGAQIYYTTNGSNPTTNSTLYTAPFTVSANTTVKAISALDGEVSDVAIAEYVIETPTVVQNIWESLLLDNGEIVQFVNPVQVLAQHNNYLYVKDETGFALFYGNCEQSYVMGDIIPAGFGGTMTTYNCEREMYRLHGFRPASGNSPVTPELITAAQVGHETFAHLVELRGVVFNHDGNSYTIEDANGNQAAVYFNSMGMTPPSNLDAVYNLIAIVGSYGNPNNGCIYQLLPISYSGILPPETICDRINSVDDGTIIMSDLETQVTYQSGNYLYFKQDGGCFGMIYGNIGQTYQMGDIIPPGWTAKKTTYNSEPELVAPFEGFLPATRNEPVIPEEASPLDVNHDHWAHYVVMRDVTVTKADGYNYIIITDSQGNSCRGYLRFMQEVPDGHYDTIWGIVGSYRTEYELLVTDIDPKPVPIAPDVNNLAELYELNPGVVAQFVTPMKVLYQNGPYLYVQDNEGTNGLIYGGGAGYFISGDLIVGKASWTNVQGIVRLSNEGEWLATGHSWKVDPDFMTIEDIAHESHQYIRLEGCTIQDNVITDKTGELMMVNIFDVPLPKPRKVLFPCHYTGEVTVADLNFLIDLIFQGVKLIPWDGTCDLIGFTAAYPDELAVYPTWMDCHDAVIDYSPADINDDGEINIGDVNKLIDIIFNN